MSQGNFVRTAYQNLANNLKVKARNVDGIWSRKSLEMTISILPPWWRTKIAFSIYLIAVIAFISFIFIQYKFIC